MISETEKLAIEVEDMPFKGWSTDIGARVAAELRRLASIEQELIAARKQMEAQKDEWLSWEAKRKSLEQAALELATLKRAISEAEPVAWRLPDTEASDHYGKDIFVYYGKADFVKGTKPEKVFEVLEPLYTFKGIK